MTEITGGTRSLADVRRDDCVRIEAVLFGTLQAHVHALGLNEGEVVRCRSATRGALLLETRAGRTVILDPDLARFVEISSTSC